MRTDRVELGPKFPSSSIETQVLLSQRADLEKYAFGSKLRYFIIKTAAVAATVIGLGLILTNLNPFDLGTVTIGELLTFSGAYMFKNFKLNNFYS